MAGPCGAGVGRGPGCEIGWLVFFRAVVGLRGCGVAGVLSGFSLPRYFSFNCRFQVLSSSVLFIQLPVSGAIVRASFK